MFPLCHKRTHALQQFDAPLLQIIANFRQQLTGAERVRNAASTAAEIANDGTPLLAAVVC
jgi:hypothetical protein